MIESKIKRKLPELGKKSQLKAKTLRPRLPIWFTTPMILLFSAGLIAPAVLSSQGSPSKEEATKQEKQYESTVDGFEIRQNNNIVKRRLNLDTSVRIPKRQGSTRNAPKDQQDTVLIMKGE